MKPDIRAEIAARRAEDIKQKGAAQGIKIPSERILPLVPFLQQPGVICEVKRRSPSVDNINTGLDPVAQARNYVSAGIKSISVLTEQNYFSGSLDDLIKIKTALPQTAILRKDFLISEEDVEISYKAGADAFLLIASLLDSEKLRSMYELGLKLGMTPVVELHSSDDIKKAAGFRPDLVGINSRDLKSFTIKPLQPLKIRTMINWDCRIIYESGIKTEYDIDFVEGSGFNAVLVGEAVVRDASFAEKLAAAFTSGRSSDDFRFKFWRKLYSRVRTGAPLVKICGITNHDDLEAVISLGGDVAGFILAESPRKVEPEFIESCRSYDILKVGVVVLDREELLPGEIVALLKSGALDAVQFHGNELPSEYLKWPGYKAVRIKDADSVDEAGSLPGPAVLIDAFSRDAHGGTGKRIETELVRKVAKQQSLWLAGGLNPGNIYDIINGFSPELIDISSGVESAPGIKDHFKMIRLLMK